MGAGNCVCCDSPPPLFDSMQTANSGPVPSYLVPGQQTTCAVPAAAQPLPLKPLKITIVSARHLRNADLSLPFHRNLSDPYCICEIEGKPLSRTVTDVVKDNLDPVWNHETRFADYSVGDTLNFTVWDKDSKMLKSDDFLGRTSLPSSSFYPGGFDDELLLAEAGKNQQAYLKIRIERSTPKVQTNETPAEIELGRPASQSEIETRVSVASIGSYRTSKPSSNKNRPPDYVWLEESLMQLSNGDAASFKCKDSDKGINLTPVLFVIGGCPNALCGMQAVMFAVDDKKRVDFWWVKPNKDDASKIERETLCRHGSGKHKNDPGRSKPFYQPLADLFEQGSTVKDWCFGLTSVTCAGKQVTRALIKNNKDNNAVLYMLFLWQEDWTTNPFARSKYIKGKLVYQKHLDRPEYFSRQYEIHDGAAFIADLEEGPVDKVLPSDNLKVLYEIGANV